MTTVAPPVDAPPSDSSGQPGRPAHWTRFAVGLAVLVLVAGAALAVVVAWPPAPKPISGIRPLGALGAHQAGVTGVLFSPDGSLVASSGSDGTVRFWDVATRSTSRSTVPLQFSGRVDALALDPDGSRLATVGEGVALLWKAGGSYDDVVPLPRAPGRYDSVAFSPDGLYVRASGLDGTVSTWTVASGQPRTPTLRITGRDARRTGLSSDGATLATLGFDGRLQVWDVAQRRLLATAGPATAFSFSPDGHVLAIADPARHAVVLWSVPARRVLTVLPGRPDAVTALSFSTDSSFLAAGTKAGAVQVWNLPARSLLGGSQDGFAGAVTALAFAPGDDLLTAGSADRTVRLWQLTR